MPATAEVTVSNPQGMHLRPATEFAKVVQASGCAVTVTSGEAQANGGSVLELAMMAAGQGTVLVITADGENCERALAQLVELVKNDFRR